MATYLMKNGELITADSFNELRRILIKRIKADDSYVRSLIKGVGD